MRGISGIFITQAPHGAVTRVNPATDAGVDMGGLEPNIYVVSLPSIMKSVEFPVLGCLSISYSAGWMQEHFMYRFFLGGCGTAGG